MDRVGIALEDITSGIKSTMSNPCHTHLIGPPRIGSYWTKFNEDVRKTIEDRGKNPYAPEHRPRMSRYTDYDCPSLELCIPDDPPSMLQSHAELFQVAPDAAHALVK